MIVLQFIICPCVLKILHFYMWAHSILPHENLQILDNTFTHNFLACSHLPVIPVIPQQGPGPFQRGMARAQACMNAAGWAVVIAPDIAGTTVLHVGEAAL